MINWNDNNEAFVAMITMQNFVVAVGLDALVVVEVEAEAEVALDW